MSTRRLPIDVIALVAIVVAIVATHVPLLGHGFSFGEPAWLFHFGGRVLDGDVPYRDFVLTQGPLPTYVDAAAQAMLGPSYSASLIAALVIKVVRVFVMWSLARPLAGLPAAAFVCVFCAFDPLFSFSHHWSTPYVGLLGTTSALFVVRGLDSPARAMRWFALAGIAAGLIVTVHPGTAVLVGVTLLIVGTSLVVRGFVERTHAIAFAGGWGAAWLCLAIVLLARGALGAAVTQLFVDALDKNPVHGLTAVVDALAGGAVNDGRYTVVEGALFFLALPVMFVLALLRVASKGRDLDAQTLGGLVVPATICAFFVLRDVSFMPLTDVPRIALLAMLVVVVVTPIRAREWFGIEPVLIAVVVAIPLASDAVHEVSSPGRGWSDVWGIVTGVIVLALASSHVPRVAKTWLGACFALSAGIATAQSLAAGLDPFTQRDRLDGRLADISTAPRGARGEIFDGVSVPEWRARAVEWLTAQVPAGRSCFVYGGLPALYRILDCHNPSKIDVAIASFATASDARDVVAVMRATPPEFLVVHERTWMLPPLTSDAGGYDSWFPEVSAALHTGFRQLVTEYDDLGTVASALGPDLAKQAAANLDGLDAIRVYRRKR